MKTRSALALAAVFALGAAVTFGSLGVQAETAGADVIKKRQELMKYNGESMKKLSPMFKGEAPYDAELVRKEAKGIGDFAGIKITKLFPKGTGLGSTDAKTRALPVIWQRWSDFIQYAEDLGSYSYALAAAADNPLSGVASDQGLGLGAGPGLPTPEELAKGPPQAAFIAVGKICGNCHEIFREKKQN